MEFERCAGQYQSANGRVSFTMLAATSSSRTTNTLTTLLRRLCPSQTTGSSTSASRTCDTRTNGFRTRSRTTLRSSPRKRKPSAWMDFWMRLSKLVCDLPQTSPRTSMNGSYAMSVSALPTSLCAPITSKYGLFPLQRYNFLSLYLSLSYNVANAI